MKIQKNIDDVINDLKRLASPKGETLSDSERINQFIKLTNKIKPLDDMTTLKDKIRDIIDDNISEIKNLHFTEDFSNREYTKYLVSYKKPSFQNEKPDLEVDERLFNQLVYLKEGGVESFVDEIMKEIKELITKNIE